MKTLLTVFLLILAGIVHGQKYFKAISESDSLGDYEELIPLFKYESFDITGKKGAVYAFTDGNYVNTIFNKPLENLLPKDSINKLETINGRCTRSMVSIVIDPMGKIWNIKFFIKAMDRKILTDEILYQLYQSIKKTKIDMSKIKINIIRVGKIEETYGTHTLFLYRWPEKEKNKE